MMTHAILCHQFSQRVGERHDNAFSTGTSKLPSRTFPVYTDPPRPPTPIESHVERRPPPQAQSELKSLYQSSMESFQDYQFPLKIKDQLKYRPRTPSLASTCSDESSSTITSYRSCISNDDLDDSSHVPPSLRKTSSTNSSCCPSLFPSSDQLYCQPVVKTPSDNNSNVLNSHNESYLNQKNDPILKKKPQNFRDDPQKRARVKTELCQNFMMGKPCKFGKKCNYAHGHHELKLTKLKERHEAGLLDATTYRTRPCFNQIATGAW